jgi:hypothetical protein
MHDGSRAVCQLTVPVCLLPRGTSSPRGASSPGFLFPLRRPISTGCLVYTLRSALPSTMHTCSYRLALRLKIGALGLCLVMLHPEAATGVRRLVTKQLEVQWTAAAAMRQRHSTCTASPGYRMPRMGAQQAPARSALAMLTGRSAAASRARRLVLVLVSAALHRGRALKEDRL